MMKRVIIMERKKKIFHMISMINEKIVKSYNHVKNSSINRNKPVDLDRSLADIFLYLVLANKRKILLRNL